jgi:hypothetical protein
MLLLLILLAYTTALALNLSPYSCKGRSKLLKVVKGTDLVSLDIRLSEDNVLICVVT